jgi:hypothetical protein
MNIDLFSLSLGFAFGVVTVIGLYLLEVTKQKEQEEKE